MMLRAGVVLAALVATEACATPKPPIHHPARDAMTTCTKTVTPQEAGALEQIVAELPAGAVLCLADGVYPAALWIERSLTIRGLGDKVVLDADGHKSTLSVVRDGIELTVERMTLRRGSGGASGNGGNLDIDKSQRVILRDVILEDGRSDDNGGGGIRSAGGELLLERCTLRRNHGNNGSAILISPGRTLVMRDCVVVDNSRGKPGGTAPAVMSMGGSNITIERSILFGNQGEALSIGTSRFNETLVQVTDSVLGDPPLVGPSARDKLTRVTIRNCALSRALSAPQDGGDNLVGEIKLDADYRPVAGSFAVGKGPKNR